MSGADKPTDAVFPASTDAAAEQRVNQQMQLLLDQLDEDQAAAVTTIDVRGRSSIADYIVIASGRSSRHLRSMADHVVMRLKAAAMPPLGVEGEREGEWVLIDTGDVILHLMLPKIRDFFNIESLWEVRPNAEQDADQDAGQAADQASSD